jgi:hypothetical protein
MCQYNYEMHKITLLYKLNSIFNTFFPCTVLLTKHGVSRGTFSFLEQEVELQEQKHPLSTRFSILFTISFHRPPQTLAH